MRMFRFDFPFLDHIRVYTLRSIAIFNDGSGDGTTRHGGGDISSATSGRMGSLESFHPAGDRSLREIPYGGRACGPTVIKKAWHNLTPNDTWQDFYVKNNDFLAAEDNFWSSFGGTGLSDSTPRHR